MASEISREIGRLLMSYSGPEPDRVRTAIAKLAKDDRQQTEHFVRCAESDYRDVLAWAEKQEDEDRTRDSLAGMTVNERLSALNLFPAWDAAIARGDQASARLILQKCELSAPDIEKILDGKFRHSEHGG